MIDAIKKFYGLFTALVTLFGVYYVVLNYIDSRVERLVLSDEFLGKLSNAVRPSTIFDQKGAILVDMGAMAYIENVEVFPAPKNSFPDKIIVHPNRYLSHAPLLSTIDPFVVNVSVERGAKFDWIYTLNYATFPGVSHESIRYRLEILY